jgi:hypothetical protein
MSRFNKWNKVIKVDKVSKVERCESLKKHTRIIKKIPKPSLWTQVKSVWQIEHFCLLLNDTTRIEDLNECRCDERLKSKVEGRDEVNRREVSECPGWVCDVESITDPSTFNVIRSDRLRKLNSWTSKKNGQFPDDPVKIKDTQIHHVNTQTY